MGHDSVNKLEVIDLTKSFGDGAIKAVDGISFSVPEGIIFGLVGRNGAGKTTTIRMLIDIYSVDSGKVLFNGQERNKDFHKRVGYLPEERGLYPKMSIMDNLLFLAEIKGKSPAEIKPKVYEYLDRFELSHRSHENVGSLSKGNQQKIQIIGTVIHDPDFVILDEPFSGLDPVTTNTLKDLILDLKKAGKVVMLSTHMMDMAEKMCDHIAMIQQGSLILNAPVADIKKQYSESNITLSFDGDISFISSLPYVESVEDFGKSVSIRVSENQHVQTLLQELINRNVVIKKFESGDISLHEIFVKLTQEATEESKLMDALDANQKEKAETNTEEAGA